MKLNYDAKLTDPKGNPVGEATLGALLYDVALVHEEGCDSAKKLKLARIAQKIAKGEDLVLEEKALIKERALKYAVPAVVLCVEDLLEGKE